MKLLLIAPALLMLSGTAIDAPRSGTFPIGACIASVTLIDAGHELQGSESAQMHRVAAATAAPHNIPRPSCVHAGNLAP